MPSSCAMALDAEVVFNARTRGLTRGSAAVEVRARNTGKVACLSPKLAGMLPSLSARANTSALEHALPEPHAYIDRRVCARALEKLETSIREVRHPPRDTGFRRGTQLQARPQASASWKTSAPSQKRASNHDRRASNEPSSAARRGRSRRHSSTRPLATSAHASPPSQPLKSHKCSRLR